MTGVRVALGLGGGQLLLGPVGALYCARALALAARAARVDGIRQPPDLVELRAALDRAAAQARATAAGTPELPVDGRLGSSDTAPTLVLVDPVGAAEAASLLNCSGRNVRALCRRGVFSSAVRRPGGWQIERADVVARALAQADTRKAA